MKKLFRNIIILTAIDQIIKFIVTKYFIGAKIVLIPNLLYFEPFQNTNLSWVAALNDYVAKTWQMTLIGILIIILLILIYRYLLYIYSIVGLKTNLIHTYSSIVFAGATCALIDIIFWGGSWDYIGLFHWFIFDLKDLYLATISFPILIVIIYRYEHKYKSLVKSEQLNDGFIYWIKSGIPTVHKDL